MIVHRMRKSVIALLAVMGVFAFMASPAPAAALPTTQYNGELVGGSLGLWTQFDFLVGLLGIGEGSLLCEEESDGNLLVTVLGDLTSGTVDVEITSTAFLFNFLGGDWMVELNGSDNGVGTYLLIAPGVYFIFILLWDITAEIYELNGDCGALSFNCDVDVFNVLIEGLLFADDIHDVQSNDLAVLDEGFSLPELLSASGCSGGWNSLDFGYVQVHEALELTNWSQH